MKRWMVILLVALALAYFFNWFGLKDRISGKANPATA
jgi:hypothetical protein